MNKVFHIRSYRNIQINLSKPPPDEHEEIPCVSRELGFTSQIGNSATYFSQKTSRSGGAEDMGMWPTYPYIFVPELQCSTRNFYF